MKMVPDESVPTFSVAERDRRWALARELMDREGLDALLVFGEHEDAGPASAAYDRWFTNGRAGTTVIVPRAGEPVALLPSVQYILDHLESARRGDPAWIPPENLRGSRDSGAIARTLDELGLTQGSIGVVGLGPHVPWHPEGLIPFRLWNSVLAQCPRAEFTPVDTALGLLVSRLSPEEIDVVRHAPLDAADGSMFLIALHTLNPGLAAGRGRGDISTLPGAGAYPPVIGHPALMTDMELAPGMTVVLEPQYAFGRHLVHVGGTVIVGEDEPLELNPCTAQILHAAGTPRPGRVRVG